MSDEELKSLPYIPWLENALQELVKFPVKGICMYAITGNGEIYSNYHDVSMSDKLMIAGLVQQDAMMDSLVANGYIQDQEEEEA